MKKIFSLALLFALVLAFSGVCFAGDGSSFGQLQKTQVFFNNAGSTLSEGDVVVLDTRGTGVSTGTTLGSYVRLASAADGSLADSALVIGVVKATSLDQTPVVVVTEGPALTTVDDSTDAVTNKAAVGTSAGTAGRAGGGTNLGLALEPGDGTDGDQIYVWVHTTGAD